MSLAAAVAGLATAGVPVPVIVLYAAAPVVAAPVKPDSKDANVLVLPAVAGAVELGTAELPVVPVPVVSNKSEKSKSSEPSSSIRKLWKRFKARRLSGCHAFPRLGCNTPMHLKLAS